ncbi:MAG: recombinase family protein [bacterium]|nr:recombinase family protein [bacterium]
MNNLVGIYVRVSSQEQAIEGHSIEEQLDRLKSYCNAKGLTIYKNYVDPGFTGSNINRPALENLIEDVENKRISTVLVYKLDRLSRSQKDTLHLIEDIFLQNNCDFISMTENFDTSSPFGKAMIGILSVFAQLEREQIKERMDMGRAGRAKLGLWRGGSNAPIGYDFVDGKLIVNEYEAIQVRKIFELFLEGKSFGQISKYMKSHYTNKYSNYNCKNTLGAIIKNNLYIGKIKYNDEVYDGIHEPIITSETYARANDRYKMISDKWNSQERSPYAGKHLLTGLIFCGNCGARYFTTTTKRKNAPAYSYYKCYSRDGNREMKKMDGCKNPTYRQDLLDQMILDEISNLHYNNELIEELSISSQKENNLTKELNAVKKQLETITNKINKLLELYSIGGVPTDMLSTQITTLATEKEKLELHIHELKNKSIKDSMLTVNEAKEYINSFYSTIEVSSLEEKKHVVNILINKIIIMPNKDIEIHWNF